MSESAQVWWGIVRFALAFGGFCGVVCVIDKVFGRKLREMFLKGVPR